MPTMPPIGATMVRRSSASPASRTSSSAVRAARRASRSATSVAAPRRLQLLDRARASPPPRPRRARRAASAIASASSSSRAMTSPGPPARPRRPRARRSRPETSGVTETEWIARPSPIAETRPAGLRGRTSEPITVTGPPSTRRRLLPAGRRGAVPSARGQADAGQERPGLREENRPRRDGGRHQRERREDLLPPGQSAPQLIRCPILSLERGRGVWSVAPGVPAAITLS